jgi:mono/diheme cytochrome c family protein
MSAKSWKRSARGYELALVFACVTRFEPALSAQTPRSDLPPGQGVEIVRTKCLGCHETDLIRQQRLTRPGWQRELDKMIGWGAVVTEAERSLLLDYLATNWGWPPLDSAPRSVSQRGAEVFARACLACHQTDIVEQQRLARDGWGREVQKMIGWGAALSNEEKDALIDYLARRFRNAARTGASNVP